jgi:hypothetical protein
LFVLVGCGGSAVNPFNPSQCDLTWIFERYKIFFQGSPASKSDEEMSKYLRGAHIAA